MTNDNSAPTRSPNPATAPGFVLPAHRRPFAWRMGALGFGLPLAVLCTLYVAIFDSRGVPILARLGMIVLGIAAGLAGGFVGGIGMWGIFGKHAGRPDDLKPGVEPEDDRRKREYLYAPGNLGFSNFLGIFLTLRLLLREHGEAPVPYMLFVMTCMMPVINLLVMLALARLTWPLARGPKPVPLARAAAKKNSDGR